MILSYLKVKNGRKRSK